MPPYLPANNIPLAGSSPDVSNLTVIIFLAGFFLVIAGNAGLILGALQKRRGNEQQARQSLRQSFIAIYIGGAAIAYFLLESFLSLR